MKYLPQKAKKNILFYAYFLSNFLNMFIIRHCSNRSLYSLSIFFRCLSLFQFSVVHTRTLFWISFVAFVNTCRPEIYSGTPVHTYELLQLRLLARLSSSLRFCTPQIINFDPMQPNEQRQTNSYHWLKPLLLLSLEQYIYIYNILHSPR